MSIIRIYIYATVIHFERQLLTDLPKQKKKKKEKNPLPNLVGKSAAHSHPSSHFSISLSFHEQHPQSFPFLFPSFFLSNLFFSLSRRQFTGPTMSSNAGGISARGFFSLLLYLSLFPLFLSLSFKHNSHSYMKMHGGSFLSPSRIFSLAWQEERVCVKLEEGKGRDESVSSISLSFLSSCSVRMLGFIP